jgi:hypothetical protein
MSEYQVISKEVTSVVWRDVAKAAQELTSEVNAQLSSGWEPQGGPQCPFWKDRDRWAGVLDD